ncbi:MAG: hypothetical protein P1U32_07300 [Legionellaceae bacterium]|nr:hypothetical protein [Legionellaceae bacterium]
MKKQPVKVGGGVDVKNGNLEGGSSVDVNAGGVKASSSSHASIGRRGVSSETSESHSLGNVLRDSHSHAESIGKKACLSPMIERATYLA